MNRKWGVIAAALAIGLLAGSWSSALIIRQRFERDLSERIKQQAQRDSSLSFRSVTDFEWDRLYIFQPYTTKSEIEQTLRTTWTGSMSIESGKGINLLVFTKNQRVVRYAELSRDIDFVVPKTAKGWSPTDSVFPITSDGRRFIVRACDNVDSAIH